MIKSDLRETQVPKDRILDELKRQNYGEDAIFGIKLALEEALTNAVKHGNRCDPGKSVTIRYSVTEQEAVIAIRDEGKGFVPGSIPDCTSADRLPLPNGRGLLLIRAYMDDVCYCDEGREVIFTRRRNSTRAPADADLESSPTRRTILFSGSVQGVGFRYTARSIAAGYPVTGFVRNLPDGRVEIVAEGLAADLDRMQDDIHKAMRSYIRDVEVCASPATGEFKGFSVAH